MILLSGHSLTALKKVDLEKQSLSLKERESTSMIQPVDMSDITINSWFQDEKSPGAGIVWRVKNLQQMYDQKAAQVQLEHVIMVLKDSIMFGEVTPATITGNDGATTCTARQAITYILNQQSDWVLYTLDASYENVSNNYKFNGDSLYDALDNVTKTLSDAWWTYDMSVYPFRLNITPRPSGVTCEMRPSRNLRTVSRTIDRTNMFTRFYPIGHDDLHISGNYVSQNENLYGVVSKVEVDTSRTTTAELTAWANERLSRHSEPTITIVADGLELAAATGESLDALTLGRICRVYVDEFGTTIQERITEQSYSDKVNQPESVRVTMSNHRDDVMQFLADEIKNGAGPSGNGRSGGGGRGGAVQQREDHAWFEDTDEHVAMVAEGIVGVDAQGNPNWVRLSQLIVDGAGIHGNVTSLLDGELYHQSTIEMNESKIGLVVGRYNNQNYIKVAEIVTAINDADEGVVHISADHVYMGTVGNERPIDVVVNGKLTTTDLWAKIADLASVTMLAAQITGNTVCHGALSVGTSLAVNQNYGITAAGTGNFSGIKLGSYSSFSDCVTDASVANNVLTLTKASGGTVTFSKATTLSGAWSGGTFTATASPQGDTISSGLFSVAAADITWNGNTASFPVYANLDGEETKLNTGKTLSIDASSIYTNGYNDGYPSGTVTIGSKITGTTYNISISPTSGTAKASTIDFSSIYTDARAGYTEGTFTLASVTLQGSQVSGTCYHTVSTGGTVYYTAGSSVTQLGSSVKPTSVSGYRRGSSVSMSRDTIYRKGTGGSYSEIGYCYYCQSSAGASTLYKGGDYFSYNDVGTSSTLYYAGSSVTPISGGGVRLSTVTAYTAGSTVTDTYYTKS